MAARAALEALMSTVFKDDFVDRIEARGEARGEVRGEAAILLRVLAARGIAVPARLRDRVLACTDLAQLEAWADKAATAASIDDVFTG
jgi:hypothetical protein